MQKIVKYFLLIIAITIFSCSTAKIDYTELPDLLSRYKYATVYYTEKTAERAYLVGETFDLAYDYLIHNEYKDYPLDRISIYMYQNQRKMRAGLILFAGFSKEATSFFAKGGSLVPVNNIMHVSSSFPLSGVAHELVHAFYAEKFHFKTLDIQLINEASKENDISLLDSDYDRNIKWLDEGLADYFSHKIMLNHRYVRESQIKSQKDYYDHFHKLIDDNKLIDLCEVERLSQWISKILVGDAIIIYPQSFIIVSYLVSNYGIENVFDIQYQVLDGRTVSEAFERIFSKTTEEIMNDICNASIEEVFGDLYVEAK